MTTMIKDIKMTTLIKGDRQQFDDILSKATSNNSGGYRQLIPSDLDNGRFRISLGFIPPIWTTEYYITRL